MLARLEGGPRHGQVAEISGRVPVFLHSNRQPSLLEEGLATADWEEVNQWYELRVSDLPEGAVVRCPGCRRMIARMNRTVRVGVDDLSAEAFDWYGREYADGGPTLCACGAEWTGPLLACGGSAPNVDLP